MIDVAVGTGRILEVFADRVKRGVGVDVNHAMLNLARFNLERAGMEHGSVRKAAVTAFPLADEAADLVTAHQVLHYLDDPTVEIAEFTRVLNPSGVLLIVEFAPHQLDFLNAERAHLQLGFSDSEITEWIEDAGLSLARRTTLHPDEKVGRLTVKVRAARKEIHSAEPRGAKKISRAQS